ncbi:hypothetical protein ACHAW5_000578 [Stephanodiscus triporus]|uniref:Uncharacterized protein n=1 Tax=Stephanodiscus triporus TaxID=2934178 RepID=A0ABD3PYI3_9STRA
MDDDASVCREALLGPDAPPASITPPCDDADAAAGVIARDPSSSSSSSLAARDDSSRGGGARARMGAFALAIMVFFNASGGPFGVEPSIRAAGNMYAIVGFALMPLMWSLPECVMTYELSSAYPCDSGGVRFTEEAFGETWGLVVGYLGWISGVANTASLPCLLLSYVLGQFFPDAEAIDESVIEHYGLLVSITLIFAYVNYRGLDVVSSLVMVIFFVSMMPFFLMVILGIPKGE